MKSLFSLPKSISVPAKLAAIYWSIGCALALVLYILADSTLAVLELAFCLTAFILMDSLMEMKMNPPAVFSKKLFGMFASVSSALASVVLLYLFIRFAIRGTIIS